MSEILDIPDALIVADTHLKSRVWAKHPDLVGDAYAAFRWCCEYAAKERIPMILLGDIFDSRRPSSEDVAAFCTAVGPLLTRKLPVFYIQGNHDQAEPPWPELSPGSVRLHRTRFRLAGEYGYAIDYSNPGQLVEELAAVPVGTRVLLMHQAWTSMMGHESSSGDIHQLPCRWLLTGDYHDNRTVDVPGKHGPLTAVSPGSTHLTRLSEMPVKYAVRVRGAFELETVRIPNRVFVKSLPEMPSDYEVLRAQCRAAIAEGRSNPELDPQLHRPLIHIKFRPDHTAELKQLRAEFADKCYFVAEPVIGTEISQLMNDGQTAADAASVAMTLHTAVATRLESNPTARTIALALLEMSDDAIPDYLKAEIERCISNS